VIYKYNTPWYAAGNYPLSLYGISLTRWLAQRRNNVDLLGILGYPEIAEREMLLRATPRLLCAGS